MGAIVVVGGLNLDLVVPVERLPAPGETVAGGALGLHPGGKGANQAVAAARLGARVALVGRTGADDFGRRLRASLAEAGVDLRAVRETADAPTGVALIAVDRAGQNSIVVAPGANARLEPADLLAARELFERAAVCVTQLETAPAVVEATACLAREVGCTVVLNAAPARTLPSALLAAVDLLVVNELEAATLLGLPGLADPSAAVRELAAGGPRRGAILTLGADGAWLAAADRVGHVPAFAVEAVDTTAAGDAFVGGLAVALADGLDLAQACRRAAAAGALAVTRPGAQPSLPTAAEVERLLARSGAPG